jgi:hypothetical protein
MTEHDDVERVLARHRPAGPPASLRARVVAFRPSAPRRRCVSWLPIAAGRGRALWLHLLASRTHARVEQQVMAAYVPPGPVSLDDLTAALGGDDVARAAAAAFLAESPWQR